MYNLLIHSVSDLNLLEYTLNYFYQLYRDDISKVFIWIDKDNLVDISQYELNSLISDYFEDFEIFNQKGMSYISIVEDLIDIMKTLNGSLPLFIESGLSANYSNNTNYTMILQTKNVYSECDFNHGFRLFTDPLIEIL